jgi:hypothetical protein
MLDLDRIESCSAGSSFSVTGRRPTVGSVTPVHGGEGPDTDGASST